MDKDLERLQALYGKALGALTGQDPSALESCIDLLTFAGTHGFVLKPASEEPLIKKFVSFVDTRSSQASLPELCQICTVIGLWHTTQRSRLLTIPARRVAKAIQPFFEHEGSDRGLLDQSFDVLFTVVWKTSADYLEGSVFVRDELIIPFSRNLQRTAAAADIPRRSPARIAYLIVQSELGGSYAPGKLLAGWWLGHDLLGARGIEIFIYTLGKSDEAMESFLASLTSVTVRRCEKMVEQSLSDSPERISYQLTTQFRDLCARDGIEVVIFDSVSAAMLTMIRRRIAPKQLFMPMSFIPLLSSGVDGFLLPDNLEEDAREMDVPLTQTLMAPFSVSREHLVPDRKSDEIEAARRTLPVGKIVFGTFARVQKISPAFADAVARILNAVPDSIFFAAGPGDTDLVTRLFSSAGCDMNRVAILPKIDPHTYGTLVDVYLETFPIAQGLAAVEIMAKRIPVVHFKSPGLSSICEKQRDARAVTSTIDDYVHVAATLATNSELRAAYGARAREIVEPIMNVEANAAALNQAILSFLERGSSSTPGASG